MLHNLCRLIYIYNISYIYDKYRILPKVSPPPTGLGQGGGEHFRLEKSSAKKTIKSKNNK